MFLYNFFDQIINLANPPINEIVSINLIPILITEAYNENDGIKVYYSII